MFWKKSPRKKLETLLHDGSTAMDAGDFDGAFAIYDRLVRDAAAARDPILEAAGLQRRGVVRDLRGESLEAERDVRAALQMNRTTSGVDRGTLRQDLFSLGVILARRGDSLAAEAPFLESAEIAGVFDQDAHYRAIHSVLIGRLQREDQAGAIELLWNVRPGGDSPRWLVGSLDAHHLARLLIAAGRLDDALMMLPNCLTAMAYWSAKRDLGSIGEETLSAVYEASVKTAVACARGAAEADRREDAGAVLELLARMPDIDGVEELRAELLG